jgi:hypothetical protein
MPHHSKRQPRPTATILNLPNAQDSNVIRELCVAKISSLPIDRFARLLCRPGESLNDDHVIALRDALIRVYIDAAMARLNTRAARTQIALGYQSLYQLTKALGHLHRVGLPAGQIFHDIFGAALDDSQGLSESNEFSLACWQIKLDITSNVTRLYEVLERENQKPTKMGERKKRLRALVEGLANWWESTGKSVAPYVYAKRLAGHPARVIDRKGEFVSITIAMFCELERFKKSEVLAAITNVHEARLKQPIKSKISAQ